MGNELQLDGSMSQLRNVHAAHLTIIELNCRKLYNGFG